MSAGEHHIVISEDGRTLVAIYTDEIDFSDLGDVKISRASHVEPAPNGGWQADLSPVGGPLLSGFAKRQEALAAEIAWLEDNLVRGGLSLA